MLTVELSNVHRSRFAVTSTQRVDRPLFVFVQALEGFEPRDLPRGAIRTAQGYFLPVELGEDGSAALTFDQLRRATATVNVASAPDHPYVAALLGLLDESDDVARLRAILDRRTVIARELETLGEDLRAERGALDERRAALEALRGVTSGGDVRARLSQAIAQGVARVEALTSRTSALRAEQIALDQEWYGRLRALTVRR
ncbi:MAG TPA: hypothetical protein VIL20_22590 [Sandaracinaceae bacterium]